MLTSITWPDVFDMYLSRSKFTRSSYKQKTHACQLSTHPQAKLQSCINWCKMRHIKENSNLYNSKACIWHAKRSMLNTSNCNCHCLTSTEFIVNHFQQLRQADSVGALASSGSGPQERRHHWGPWVFCSVDKFCPQGRSPYVGPYALFSGATSRPTQTTWVQPPVSVCVDDNTDHWSPSKVLQTCTKMVWGLSAWTLHHKMHVTNRWAQIVSKQSSIDGWHETAINRSTNQY
jgi:hypothetical protein